MERKIIVKITPAAILLVVLLLVGAFLLTRGVRQGKRLVGGFNGDYRNDFALFNKGCYCIHKKQIKVYMNNI